MIVKRKFAQKTWATGAGNAAQTADLESVDGIPHVVEIKISSVTANPTVGVVLSDITDTDFVTTLETFSTLADGTLHKYLRMSKEYAADKDIDGHVFCRHDLRVTITPSADAGGTLQTLAVDVTLYLEE